MMDERDLTLSALDIALIYSLEALPMHLLFPDIQIVDIL